MTEFMVLRAAHRRPQPWKNGGGVTSEVMVYPPGSGMDDFHWRASIAEVAEAGPFSCFEGIDRVLTVLAGELELAVSDRPASRLTPQSMPHAFQADLPTYGTPINGVVTDFNIMCRRGKWATDVRRLHVGATGAITHGLAGPAIFLATGPCTLRIRDDVWTLKRFDAAYVPDLSVTDISVQTLVGPLVACLTAVNASR